jgi:hypothetical protein
MNSSDWKNEIVINRALHFPERPARLIADGNFALWFVVSRSEEPAVPLKFVAAETIPSPKRR